MRVDETVAEVVATVEYLRISTGPAAPAGDWLACEPLVSQPRHLLEVVRSTATARGTDDDAIATSLFVQGYAFRIASTAVGAWLVGGDVLDLDPAVTSIAIGRGRPNGVHLDPPRAVEAAAGGVGGLHEHLVDRHLSLLVGCAHASCRIGAPLLWGNVAAAIAASFGAFMDPLGDRRLEIRSAAQHFFAGARPELARAGRVVPVGARWAWERSSCCLWYQTESGFMCEDCSLRTDEERRARYEAMRSQQVMAGELAG